MKYLKLTMALLWVMVSYSYGFSQTLRTTTKAPQKISPTSKPASSASSNMAGTYRVTFTRILKNSQGNDFYGTAGVYLEANTKSGKATIKPLGRKPNRALDIPKGRPVKRRKLSRGVSSSRLTFITPTGSGRSSSTWTYGYTVDRVREFRLAGEAANSSATFDFQFNLKDKLAFGEKGKWERVKIKVKDLKLGKEYFFYSRDVKSSANFGICFKVEKIR